MYRALRAVNPSPYMFFLRLGDFSMAGSSPEVLVRCEDGEITLRPIAGTRKRGKTAEEDKALEKELLADPKERAEHIMLVDLGRNDVGRVSEMGSVNVDELMVIEKYSHVMHIVSNIKGRLKKGWMPLMLLWHVSLLAQSLARQKSGQCRLLTSLSRQCAGPMQELLDISASLIIWIPV